MALTLSWPLSDSFVVITEWLHNYGGCSHVSNASPFAVQSKLCNEAIDDIAEIGPSAARVRPKELIRKSCNSMPLEESMWYLSSTLQEREGVALKARSMEVISTEWSETFGAHCERRSEGAQSSKQWGGVEAQKIKLYFVLSVWAKGKLRGGGLLTVRNVAPAVNQVTSASQCGVCTCGGGAPIRPHPRSFVKRSSSFGLIWSEAPRSFRVGKIGPQAIPIQIFSQFHCSLPFLPCKFDLVALYLSRFYRSWY